MLEFAIICLLCLLGACLLAGFGTNFQLPQLGQGRMDVSSCLWDGITIYDGSAINDPKLEHQDDLKNKWGILHLFSGLKKVVYSIIHNIF